MNTPARPIATQPVRWRLRTKLLTLLLGITVLPLVFITWIDFKAVRGLGRELAAQTHAELSTQAREQLAQTADNYALLIQRQNEVFELLVARQAREVSLLLEDRPAPQPVSTTPFILDTDIDRGDGRLRSLPVIDRRGSEPGARDTIAYDTQVFRLSPGLAVADHSAQIERLLPMTDIYRALHKGQQQRILWHYTTLESGVHSVYPGHGGYPADYDPRQRGWYRLQKSDPNPRWQPAQIDASTRRPILTFSSAVRNDAGAFLGVTAIDVPVSAYLDTLPLPGGWSSSSNIYIATARPTGDDDNARSAAAAPTAGLRILARQRYGDGPHDWRTDFADDILKTGDDAADARLLADLLANRNGVIEAGPPNESAIWAYRRIGDTATWLVMILPHARVDATAASARDQALDDTGRELRTQLALGLPLIALAVAGALLSARAINRPLQELVRATQRLGAGDFDARAHIATGDELEMLGHAFNHMVPHLKERFRHAEGMRLAREVQQNLIPAGPPPRPGLDVAGVTEYCEETGGDYYDYLELGSGDGDPLGVAIGDVSGHGISSALLMATARALLHAFARQSRTLAEAISAINERLADDVHQGRFMTLFYLVVNPATRTLRWVSAGHDPALLYRPEGQVIEELSGDDIPLGVDDAWLYREAPPRRCSAGDIVLLGTDGVWDTRNRSGDSFGKERLRELLRANAGGSAMQICSAVTDGLREFRGGAAQRDDLTVVVLRIL